VGEKRLKLPRKKPKKKRGSVAKNRKEEEPETKGGELRKEANLPEKG